MRLWPLDQRANNALRRGDPTKIILLRGNAVMCLKDMGVAGMRAEISDIFAHGHLTCIGCGSIQHDHGRARFQLIHKAMRDFADQAIWHGHNNNIGIAKGGFSGHTVKPRFRLKACLACFGHFDRGKMIAALHQVARNPHTHFAARTKKCNFCHDLSFRFGTRAVFDPREIIRAAHLPAL